MKTLTERQKKILTYIQQFISENGYPPTHRNIAHHFNFASTFGVKRHLEDLEKKGYLNIDNFVSRGITLSNKAHEDISFSSDPNQVTRINILGRVAAGIPISAIENLEGSILLDSQYIKKNKDYFALRITGDSMINAGIFDGDIVIVNYNCETYHDEIVVAIIEGEATVKRLYNKNNKLLLIPENEKYQPIDLKKFQNISIIGKVDGLLRWL